jgi:hypothetical protein
MKICLQTKIVAERFDFYSLPFYNKEIFMNRAANLWESPVATHPSAIWALFNQLLLFPEDVKTLITCACSFFTPNLYHASISSISLLLHRFFATRRKLFALLLREQIAQVSDTTEDE